jgi:predicted transcriptional regulator
MSKLAEIAEKFDFKILCGEELLNRKVTGGYAGDMLSDVLAHAKKGDIWITMQIHLNIVPIAVMKELAGILIVNGKKPEGEVIQKARDEKVPLLGTSLNTFQVAGKLYPVVSGHK